MNNARRACGYLPYLRVPLRVPTLLASTPAGTHPPPGCAGHEPADAWLAAQGVARVVAGHKPCGDSPFVVLAGTTARNPNRKQSVRCFKCWG
jgi:hypothetical protein